MVEAREPYTHEQLARLLSPRSIAVVGATERAGAFGERVLTHLSTFSGPVYPVNARYESLGGRRSFASVAALPERPDLAVICVSREHVAGVAAECAAAGVGGAIVLASGYAETGKPGRAEEQAALSVLARTSGMRIVGPNTIGVVLPVVGAVTTFLTIAPPIPPPARHAVGIVSQSGAIGMALAQASSRGVAFSHVLTSGNSCDVDMADYVSYLAADPACDAIACALEGMAAPSRLLVAADRAREAGKAESAALPHKRRKRGGRRAVAHRLARARVDPLFGPLVVVGFGGVLVELLRDTVSLPAPVSVDEARAMLGRLRGAALLDGFRGLPVVDRDALAGVVARLSEFAADHAAAVCEIDVNPLIATARGLVAVDALIVRTDAAGKRATPS